MTDTDYLQSKCNYHILHPEDDVEEHIEIYRKIYPDCDVYMKPGKLSILGRENKEIVMNLIVIACEEIYKN